MKTKNNLLLRLYYLDFYGDVTVDLSGKGLGCSIKSDFTNLIQNLKRLNRVVEKTDLALNGITHKALEVLADILLNNNEFARHRDSSTQGHDKCAIM